jgi:hypothetical protein
MAYDHPEELAKALSHLGGVVSVKEMTRIFKMERERARVQKKAKKKVKV